MRHTAIRAGLLAILVGVLATPIAAGAPSLTHHSGRLSRSAGPVLMAGPTQSINWSGYVVTGGPYTSVTGHWTVPRVTPTFRLRASAIWIGLGGALEDNLIQTGTEQDSIDGSTGYYAWWEILPAPATPITAFSVRPGDQMSATISRLSSGKWRISITDARSGSFSVTRAYRGTGSSAEWIEEAPFLGRRLAPLASHGAVTFDRGTVNRTNPSLSAQDAIAMVQDGVTLAMPSSPDHDRDGFRIRQGDAAPGAPPS